ncbi:MAG: hypothetical protein AUK48_12425 [Oscillatoriales cyanobacterium CG2_30_44_21]|nr:MAG: hypothetical protein AUK48_12425 [Oscillatoriales cyanobacterium CG2_30_44_21]
MAVFLYPLYTLCHLLLLVWIISLYADSHQFGLLVLVAITTAIAYDNLIISLGQMIGTGNVLLRLSQPRFFCHVVLTPLSVIAAFSFCLQTQLVWAIQPFMITLISLITIALIAAEILTYYKEFEPTAENFQGTLRYTNSAYKTAPIPSIVTTIIVGILGFFLWKQFESYWLMSSSIVMVIGGAMPQKVAGPLICAGGEVILILGFCLTASQIQSFI